MEEKKSFWSLKPFDAKNALKFLAMSGVLSLFLGIIISIVAGALHITSLFSGDLVFSDYVETISYCVCGNPYTGEPYNVHSIYPPFAYLPFYPFAWICKGDLISYLEGSLPLERAYTAPSILISYILFLLVNWTLVGLVMWRYSKKQGVDLAYLLIATFTFGPILYCTGRGNVLIVCFLCGLVFFWLYDSPKRWQREMANLALAAAVGIKIYPIILITLFLKDRRFPDLWKTLLYSLILLFLPFAIVEGGFGNIQAIWNNFHTFSGEGRGIDWSNISADGLAMKIRALFELSGGDFSALGLWISRILRYGLLLTAIVLPIFSKKSEKKAAAVILAIGAYELYQGVSYAYTMIYLLVPIVMTLNEWDTMERKDKWYYGICFFLLSLSFPLFCKFAFPQSLVLMALVGKAIVDLIQDDLRLAKEGKAKAATEKEAEASESVDR